MTDEESKKAYFSMPGFGDPIPPTRFEIWQAAVEWATKRERERCLNWIGAFSTGDDLSHSMIDSIAEGR